MQTRDNLFFHIFLKIIIRYHIKYIVKLHRYGCIIINTVTRSLFLDIGYLLQDTLYTYTPVINL